MEIFLDTNLMIDYLENRNQKVVIFLQKLFENKNIEVSTSFFNQIELIDKIQEITHLGNLVIKRKYCFDEIIRAKREKELIPSEREKIFNDIENFFKDKKIKRYILESKDARTTGEIITSMNLESQDALIISTYHTSQADMFLSNDKKLIDNVKNKIENCFHLNSNFKELEKELKKD
jgi:predicted nucleic acid-binding protein